MFWAASCSLCTGALQGIARAGNQLQRCSTSGRRRMGPEKALCALAPTTHPLPPREGPSKGPSQKRHKTSFWELHSRKCNSPRETKLSPNACLLRKAALSGFSPRSLLALGPRRFCAAYCSLGTGAVLVVSAAGNQLQMCTPLWRRRMGPEKALCAPAPATHIPPAREGPS